jgi:hypothetical protein
VRAQQIAELVRLIDEGKISGKIAKTVFDGMLDSDRTPDEIVAEKGLEQVSDTASIETAVEQILAAHTKQVTDFQSGNEKIFGFLVGQIMKATQGKANPQKVNEILRRKLKRIDGESRCRFSQSFLRDRNRLVRAGRRRRTNFRPVSLRQVDDDPGQSLLAQGAKLAVGLLAQSKISHAHPKGRVAARFSDRNGVATLFQRLGPVLCCVRFRERELNHESLQVLGNRTGRGFFSRRRVRLFDSGKTTCSAPIFRILRLGLGSRCGPHFRNFRLCFYDDRFLRGP